MSSYSKSLRKPHVWSVLFKTSILLFRGCLHTSENKTHRPSVSVYVCSFLLSHWELYKCKADEWISHQILDRLLGFSVQVSYQSPKLVAGKLRWKTPVFLSTRLSPQQFTHDTERVSFPSKHCSNSLQTPTGSLTSQFHVGTIYLELVKSHSLMAQETASLPIFRCQLQVQVVTYVSEQPTINQGFSWPPSWILLLFHIWSLLLSFDPLIAQKLKVVRHLESHVVIKFSSVFFIDDHLACPQKFLVLKVACSIINCSEYKEVLSYPTDLIHFFFFF